MSTLPPSPASRPSPVPAAPQGHRRGCPPLHSPLATRSVPSPAACLGPSVPTIPLPQLMISEAPRKPHQPCGGAQGEGGPLFQTSFGGQ